MFLQIASGLVLSSLIGYVGHRRAALSAGGVVGAILTGTIVFGVGGAVPGLLLVAFFTSSSVLSQLRPRAKAQLADKFQKGSQRDLGQALANGGWAAVLVLACYAYPSFTLAAALAGALATVTADTWATEIGVLSTRPPRLVTTGRPVAVGTSGGITLLGTLTSLAGGAFIGLVVAPAAAIQNLLGPDSVYAFGGKLTTLLWTVALGGLAGSLFDSLLGATVQAMYFCDNCGRETEQSIHRCGNPTRLVRGVSWLDNDVVNFAASIFGSVVAGGLWAWLA